MKPDKAKLVELQAAKDLLFEAGFLNQSQNHGIQSKLDRAKREKWVMERDHWKRDWRRNREARKE